MKTLYCINNWVNDPACCGERGSNLFIGIMIENSNGNKFWHEQPYHARISKGKLFIVKDGQTKQYYLSEFNQTETELKEILQRCAVGQFDNTLIKKPAISYVVNDGDQSVFLAPKNADENYLPVEYYTVYIDGEQIDSGTGEREFILQDGDVFFTVPIEDLTDEINDDEPSDPYVVTIEYWVKK